ncbi:hypothetical protein SRHO_G00038870 [Serrasalmus rhombeus]
MPLQSKFLSQLDVHSKKLMKLFKKRGGQMGRRLENIVAPMVECILQTADEALIQGSIEETTLGIYVFKQRDGSREPDISVVLEGQVVLQELNNVALATAMLFGLMYALNLNYPPEFKYTFEVLQKVVMELEGTTLSKKAQALKNRLYQ